MDRRSVIVGVGAVASTAGCLATLTPSGPDTATAVDGVANYEFSVVEENPDGEKDGKPTVSCSAADGGVRVSGRMWSGNTCTEVGVDSMSLEDGRFEVVVGTFEGDGPCTQGMGSVAYEATFEFRDGAPTAVTAVESIPEDWGPTRRRTVDCGTA
ncbi:hypothetical protein [Halostella litorea]|uniref:hypothetical protein n=1 Tax=Halostella litorea TaxID=2528831 RepID=UPI001092039B|nr:hypothetical protein [Halostella litorea]